MAEDAVVLGVGLMTSVGLSAPETVAAVRAETMRFTTLDWLDSHAQPYTLAEVVEDGLPEFTGTLPAGPHLTAREVRLLRLATMPLHEALRPLGPAQTAAFIAALPECESRPPLDSGRLLALIAR